MDSPRGLSNRIRAWRATVGSAIAGRPTGHFSQVASEPLVPDEDWRSEAQQARPTPSMPPGQARADSLLAVAAASGATRYGSASRPRPTYAPPRATASPAAPYAGGDAGAEAQLAQLSAAARTAAALGWDVCALAAPEERDVLLGDDLRAVAAQLRGCLAAAAVQGDVAEHVLGDAFDALDELGYVLEEFERSTVPWHPAMAAPRSTSSSAADILLPARLSETPPPPPPPRVPPPPPQPAPDTEKPLIDL